MPILFKSKLSSAVANATFLDKTIDDLKKGKLGLFKVTSSEADAVEDVQAFLNELADATGVNGEGDATRKTYSSTVYVSNGDNRKVAIGKLDAQLNLTQTDLDAAESTIADHESRIDQLETDVQAIEDSLGQPNGIATLDSIGKVPSSQLPSYVDDVLEYANQAAFPLLGESGIIYVAVDTNKIYRWSGSIYIEVSPSSVISVNGQSGVVTLTKSDVGLSNVTNDAQLKRSSGDFNTFTEKISPVDDDIVLIEDSEDSFNKKKLKLQSLIGGVGSGGGSLSWEKIGNLSPVNESQDGIKLESFDFFDEQEIFLTINVPASYAPGDQIKINGGTIFISATSGNVLIRTTTTLLRVGSTVLGSYPNTHTSTNSQITVNPISNTLTAIGSIDLTSSVGQINGVSVQPNDKLLVRLFRAISSESISAQAKAKLLINNFEVSFN